MTQKKTLAIGLSIATTLHVLLLCRLIPSTLLFPGFLAHLFIGGLHGGIFLLDLLASLVEIAINAVIYAAAIRLVARLRSGI